MLCHGRGNEINENGDEQNGGKESKVIALKEGLVFKVSVDWKQLGFG